MVTDSRDEKWVLTSLNIGLKVSVMKINNTLTYFIPQTSFINFIELKTMKRHIQVIQT